MGPTGQSLVTSLIAARPRANAARRPPPVPIVGEGVPPRSLLDPQARVCGTFQLRCRSLERLAPTADRSMMAQKGRYHVRDNRTAPPVDAHW
jgi:hypothetical protein